MTRPSPRTSAGRVLNWLLLVLGSLGTLLGLMLLVSGSGGQDQHGYASIFGGFLLVASIPFVLTGLMSVLPKRAALWVSRISVVLGVVLIVGLVIWLNGP